MDKILYEENFNNLSRDEKQKLMISIENKYENLKFKSFEEYETEEGNFSSAVFILDNSEFVFIPGKETHIGFSDKNSIMKNKIYPYIDEYLKDETAQIPCLLNSTDEFFNRYLTKRRKFKMEPTLVERDKIEVKCINNPEEKNQNDSKLYYDGVFSILDIKRYIKESGFSIITGDEWEYLSGGENPDIFIPSIYQEIEKYATKNMSYFDDEPYLNKFGLFINYNNMEAELVDSPYLCKGSDFGDIISLYNIYADSMPYSSHYIPMQRVNEEDIMADGFDIYVRRVLRLNNL
ncbi:hypothetical protein [Clostridium sp. BJN0001]|uniref:hypothetical protein n=1 Tax=Clostridium sp. BJN0001 TaxID=2930219 RepID=UPI001FD177F1|nr:hypothetical protein [Clostridium sp. BJN0001]